MDWYCICKQNRESIDHLYLHCEGARDLGASIFGNFVIDWVILSRWLVVGLLEKSFWDVIKFISLENGLFMHFSIWHDGFSQQLPFLQFSRIYELAFFSSSH